MNKIYRSKTDKKIAGVCGGLSNKLNIDSTILRLIWVIASIVLGAGTLGLIIYIICAVVIPEEPDAIDVDGCYTNDAQNSQHNYTDVNEQQNTQNSTTYYDPKSSNTSGTYNQSGSYNDNSNQ